MTEQNKWLQVKALLKKLTYLSEQDIESLPMTKNALWMKLSKLTRNSISYHFEEDVQIVSNKIFDQLNELLGTKKATDIKEKGKKKLEQFPEIMMRIINESQQQMTKLQQQGEQQAGQKALANVFGRTIPRWTYSELNYILQRKLKNLKNRSNLSDLQNKELTIIKRFKQHIIDMDVNIDLVDRLITNRIGQNPNDTLNSSTISEVARSFQTLQSNDDSEMKDIISHMGKISLDRQTQSEVKVKQKEIVADHKKQQIKGSFMKKEHRFLDELEEIPKPELPKFQVKVQNKQQGPKPQEQAPNSNNKKMNLDELPVFSTQRRNFQEKQENRSQTRSSTNQSQSTYNEEVSFTQINESILEDENRKQYQGYSEQLIERFSSQIRFTKGTYQNRRVLQIREIEQNQLQPLIAILKGLTGQHLDKFSQSYSQVKVDVYGSFANKAGFRKTSDININLTIDGIQQRNMHSILFGLRNLLDNYRKRGMLSSLNLRSVIYSQQHQQVILSHENNRSKRRQPNVVNFIYLTINKSQYVLSSQFMGQTIYSGQEKATDVANLTNLLHLLFKGNCILDHKDIYHVWWTQTPNDKVKKKQSQSRYVSMSIYALHMMVLYYLQEEGIIGAIAYSNEKKTYDFELLKPRITLFQMFGGFLRFYCSEGSYMKTHVGSVIDVVDDRPREKDEKIRKLVQNNASKIQSKEKGYLFNFVHPRSDEFIESNPAKCLSFEIPRGSNQEKLLLNKIDDMLKIVANLRPGKKFEPNELFGWNNLQYE